MPTKDLPELGTLFFSYDNGKTYHPFTEIKTFELPEKLDGETYRCMETTEIDSYSFSGTLLMTKQQQKKFISVNRKIENRISRSIRRWKRYKEQMRRLKLKNGKENANESSEW